MYWGPEPWAVGRMEGADKSTEPWRHPPLISEPILPNIFEQILAWRTYYETLSCCITISSNVSLCRLSN